MKTFLVSVAFASVLACGGCASVASFAANIGAASSSTTPTQVKTLAAAVQTATLVTKGADAAINAHHFSRPVLLEINALNDGVHTALTDLEAENAKGHNLDFAAFNAALAAYNKYMSSEGIAH